MADVTMRIWRGDATGGDFEDYTLAQNEGEVVLDVIHRIQATEAPDLACRWNCKAGKCGSCSAEINGKPATHVHDAHGPAARRSSDRHADEGLPDHPRPRDRRLVQLRDGQARAGASPAADARGRLPHVPAVTSSAARSSASASSASCARTSVTSSATTRRTSRTTPGRGSSSATPSSRCTRSTRTTVANSLKEEMGLGYCNITKCCTEVCPEHIHITDNAIIPLKERVVDADYDPVAWLGRKIRRRTKKTADRGLRPARTVGRGELPLDRVVRGAQRDRWRTPIPSVSRATHRRCASSSSCPTRRVTARTR